MKWEKVNKKQIAQGKNGKFIIEQNRGLYYAEYWGNSGAGFKLPRNKSIKKLKQMCQDNWYWED